MITADAKISRGNGGLGDLLQECVEVSPTATEVHVKFPDVAAGGSLKKEEWSVLRDGGRVALRRPNGNFVIPEKH